MPLVTSLQVVKNDDPLLNGFIADLGKKGVNRHSPSTPPAVL